MGGDPNLQPLYEACACKEVEGALGACKDKVVGCGLRQANPGMLVQIQQGLVVPLFTWVRLVLVLVSQVSVGEFQTANQVLGSMLQARSQVLVLLKDSLVHQGV
jgi:hypothetical protein